MTRALTEPCHAKFTATMQPPPFAEFAPCSVETAAKRKAPRELRALLQAAPDPAAPVARALTYRAEPHTFALDCIAHETGLQQRRRGSRGLELGSLPHES